MSQSKFALPRNGFTFKRFFVAHDRCAMKVGTDGILLGAWAPIAGVKHVLDIGAGSGYRLLAGYDLPPLMLTTKESEAMIAAIRLLKTWGVEALSQSLESAQEKMLAILPEARRRQAEQTRLFAPDLGAHRYAKTHFDVIHQAVSNQQVLQLHYQDESGQVTWREVLPLGLFFWGERWLLVAWCELRNDYRNFRLDRCLEVRRTERRFSECADRSLSDFLRKVRCEVREK